MQEEVIALVVKLQDIVRKQTKGNYPDVNNAAKSLQDYVQDATASKGGLENKLKYLEDELSKKSEKKKLCTDHIEKIRQAMRLQRKATPKGTKSTEEKRNPSSRASSDRATPLPSQTKQNKTLSPATSERATQNKTLRSELTQKDETTELPGTIDQNEEEDIRRLKIENKYMRNTLDGLHKYIIGGDERALNELKTPKHMKDNQSIVEVEANVKEVTRKFGEIKTESEYATHLFKALNERLTFDGKQDTQISLKEPPIQMARATSKDGKKTNKKENDEQPCKRHIEQLQNNFASASNVLKKLMNAEESIAERECLLSTLKCLCNYVRDLFESKTEAETSPTWDEIWSSIRKESSANQGLSHAKEILSHQMKWKRDAENAVKERECLLLALGCLFKHSQDLSEGTTEGDISSTLDQIKSSINKESPANQGLSHAGTILNIHMEWKREVEYVAGLLEELANVSQSTNNGDNSIILSHPENFGSSRDYKTKDGKKTESSRNKPMESVQNEKLMRHYGNASYILKQMKEKEVLRTDLGKRTDEVEDLMARLKKVQGENIEIKNDADSLRTRLSEHAGALLTFENPSISNLSDPNRPTKLAEMYSELYDNKWTDAFANLAKEDPDISEKKIIGFLYDMLVDGYRFCEDVRQTQKSSLEDILFYPAGGMKTSQRRQKEEISTILANHLSDVAKLSSNKSSVHMAKAFVRDEKTKDKYRKMIKLCETYIHECVQLCWLMQVQTPPVCLDHKTIQGQTFNKNYYREYTKKGKKIAFVVWPALFLHENGPLLIKGVAQGE